MLRNLARLSVFLGLLALLPDMAAAQRIEIGRSSLTLAEPERWTVQSLPAQKVTYSGVSSGEIPFEGKRMILKSASGKTKAVVIARVSKTSTPVGLIWKGECNLPASPLLYQHDRSNPSDIDCLKVATLNSSPSSMDKVPALKRDLDGSLPDGQTLSYINFIRSLGRGGISKSQIVVSADFKGLDGVAVENTGKLPTALIAWAEAFAKNNRDAVGSLSGNWAIP